MSVFGLQDFEINIKIFLDIKILKIKAKRKIYYNKKDNLIVKLKSHKTYRRVYQSYLFSHTELIFIRFRALDFTLQQIKIILG